MSEYKDFYRKIQFNLQDKYSPTDLIGLGAVMHGDFPHVEYGGGRYKKLIIENPPQNISKPEEWKDLVRTIIFPEWDSLHPKTKQSDIIVRLVPTIWDIKKGVRVAGNGMNINIPGKGRECWIRVAVLDGNQDVASKELILFNIVHEIAEMDYWVKTSPDEMRQHLRTVNEADLLVNDLDQYHNLTDEKIANGRAFRALQRKWPAEHIRSIVGSQQEIT